MATSFNTYQIPKVWPITRLRPSDRNIPHLRNNTQSFTSPFTRNTQTLRFPGALWVVNANFPPFNRPDTQRELHAFITSLDGAGGRFIFPAYTCRYTPPAPLQAERVTFVPLTADITTITADTTRVTADRISTQLETIFSVSACPDNYTISGYLQFNSGKAPLRVGSFISWDESDGGVFVDRHMHEVVAMTYAPTTGAAVLTVRPAMTYQPTPATQVHTYAPSVVLRMVDDDQAIMQKAGSAVSVGFSAIQSRPVRITI